MADESFTFVAKRTDSKRDGQRVAKNLMSLLVPSDSRRSWEGRSGRLGTKKFLNP